MTDAERLCDRVGHRFNDTRLLTQALTHRSAGTEHNERLEFLGDSVLGLVVTEHLYQQFPGTREGELTRARARLVRKETLAKLARRLELGPVLVLGPGELKSGGRDRSSILADALEALIGALFLDGGLATCRRFVLELMTPELAAFASDGVEKDAKTALQEVLQGRQEPLPRYELLEDEELTEGHRFRVLCTLDGIGLKAEGRGSSRRLAEQDAARSLLTTLEEASHD
ncbi:MAG: ribonuclease III [Pseudomonadota bacterium]